MSQHNWRRCNARKARALEAQGVPVEQRPGGWYYRETIPGNRATNMKPHNTVLLIGLHTAEEWQCAHEAVKHAEKGRRVRLEFEASDGEPINVSVQRKGRQIIVRKEP